MVEGRLREQGHRAPLVRLTGEYAADDVPEELRAGQSATGERKPPLAVAAGRHIPEKRIPAIPAAVALAREQVPDLRCLILGDGPDTEETRAKVRELGLNGAVEVPGKTRHAEVIRAISSASCLLHPSGREGYGLVVVEAASLGTPSIVVEGSENAATELVEPGVNGFVVDSADPEPLAGAILDAIRGGSALRTSTRAWYEEHRQELSIESSLATVEASYS
jgi:glycosyltransferase involved in cell wall biosynthesis